MLEGFVQFVWVHLKKHSVSKRIRITLTVTFLKNIFLWVFYFLWLLQPHLQISQKAKEYL